MRRRQLWLAIASGLLVRIAHGQAPPEGEKSSRLSAADQKLVKELADANLGEIELGKLAQQKAASAEVKAFGARMAQDHAGTMKKLRALADGRGMALPDEPSAGRLEQARTLQRLDGAAFDTRYMAMAVTEHRQSLAALKKAERASWDTGFKQFAADALAVVTEHLAQAERLAAATAGGKPAKR